jgi:ABC-type transport system involved in multi-copper enzyme maturation permease subunit
MLPGPIFLYELRSAARRKRTYFFRVLVGLFLLYLVLISSWRWNEGHFELAAGEMSAHEMASLGSSLFASVIFLQAAVILLLTPAFLAGAIAEDRQRKVLLYLLASPLTGTELVLGKMAARLFNLVVMVLVGLPVISIALFLGGIEPEMVWLSYAASFSLLYLVAGLSLFNSAFTERPRDAILRTYLLGIIWLLLPVFEQIAMGAGGSTATFLMDVRPVTEWITLSSPASTWMRQTGGRSAETVLHEAFWTIGLQVLYGTLLLAWPVLRLRAFEKGSRLWGLGWLTSSRNGRSIRLLSRRPCGDRPMLWKECSEIGLTGSPLRIVATVLFLLIAATGLGFWFVTLGIPALRETYTFGYGDVGTSMARENFYLSLMPITCVIYLMTMFALAGAAATGITQEREKDTWISLVSTTLESSEIIYAKILGAIWRVRILLFTLLLVWLAGLICGSVHLFGFVAAIIVTTVYVLSIAVAGTFVSLRAKSSVNSLVITMGALLFVNGGYLFCCAPMMRDPGGTVLFAGISPIFVTAAPMSYDGVHRMLSPEFGGGESIVTCVLSLLGYGFLGLVLLGGCRVEFDRLVDRPRREWPGPSRDVDARGITFVDPSLVGDDEIAIVETDEAEIGTTEPPDADRESPERPVA